MKYYSTYTKSAQSTRLVTIPNICKKLFLMEVISRTLQELLW